MWLGPDPDGNASRAFELADSLRSIFKNKLLSTLALSQGLKNHWIPLEYWKSLQELTLLPWFRRAWVPQEIGTDTPAIVYWGTEDMTWEALHGGIEFLATHGWKLRRNYDINTSTVTILHRGFFPQF